MTRIHPTRLVAATLAALAMVLARTAAADPIESWGELTAQRTRRGGLFSRWGVDQQKVLAALHAIALAGRARSVVALEQRVRHHPEDVAARDLLGRAYLRLRRVGEAIAQFRAALATRPDSVSARLGLADVFVVAGRRDLAAAELAALVRHRPEAGEARERLAALQARAGEHRKAAEQLAEIVRRAPGNAVARRRLAHMLLRCGQAAAAKAHIDALTGLMPDDVGTRLLLADYHRVEGEWDAARKVLEAVAKAHPDTSASLRLGLVLLQQRAWDAAQATFGSLGARGRSTAVALAGAIVAAQGRGQAEAAVDLCRRLREAHPQLAGFLLANLWLAKGDASAVHAACAALPGARVELAPAYDELLAATAEQPDARRELALRLSLATLFRHAGWLDEAIDASRAADKLAPGSLLVGDMLAGCYGAAGHDGERLRLLGQLARSKPHSRGIALRLAEAHVQHGDLAAAREACQRLLKHRPADVDALVLMTRLAILRGDQPQALASARGALRSNPASRDALRAALDALVAAGRLEEAAAAVRTHEAANRKSAIGPLEHAVVAAAANQLVQADEQCRLAIERTPFDTTVRLLAGMILERRGDLQGALRHFHTGALAEPRFLPIQQHLGRVALRAGLGAAAVDAFRAVTKAAPHLLDAQLGLAKALSRAGRTQEAVRYLIALAPEGAAAQRSVQACLAQEYLAQGDAARAVAVAAVVLLREPAHAVARRVAVEAHHRLGDLAAAVAVCERAVASKTDADAEGDLGLLRLLEQRYKDAARRLAVGARKAPAGKGADLLFWQAAASVAAGDAPAAAAAARQALAARPTRVKGEPPSVALALVLAAAGVEPQARDELARIRKANPDVAGWLEAALPRLKADRELLGCVLAAVAAAKHGWRRRSVELLEAARQRAPTSPLVLYMVTVRHRDAGMHGRALESARQLVRRCPRSGAAHFLLGRLLEIRNDPSGAVEAYRRAAAFLDKRSTATWVAMAQSFASAGKTDDAIDAYTTVLAADPGNAPACNNLAWLYANEKPAMLAEAERLGAKAVAASPDVAAFRDTLAWIYFIRKKHDDARREAEAAVRRAPRNGTYAYHLGMIHFVQGRREQARRLLRQALELDPKLPDADTARSTLELLEKKSDPPKPEPKPKQPEPSRTRNPQ